MSQLVKKSSNKHSAMAKNEPKKNQVKFTNISTFERLFGFQLSQLSNWNSFVDLMCRPCDPASVGFTRIMFGLLMVLDTSHERGFQTINKRIDDGVCFYPLFDFIQPVDKMWLSIIYLFMVLGTFGITFGLFYRLSCLAFIIPYWYRYLLVTENWNNHSYLFGLIATILFFIDGHHFWSLDMVYRPSLRNAHVPLWNYAILRFQIFVVYFFAGIKKMDPDWLMGFSMHFLSQHWIFAPFKLIFSEEFVDHIVIHGLGFLLDLTICYFLFFDFTRPVAMFICACFHLMNSQLFSIGMFPYTMLATLPIFCYPDWPRKFFQRIKQLTKNCISNKEKPSNKTLTNHSSNLLLATHNNINNYKFSSNCLYAKSKTTNKTYKKASPAKRYHLTCMCLLGYAAIQIFLPNSNFVTQGFNHWKSGLYGYSWDMMVHSHHTLHRRIYVHFLDNDTTILYHGQNLSTRNRWIHYGRLAQQMAFCLEDRIKKSDKNVKNIAIYLDIWTSINERIIQRFFDPRVNILKAEWSVFKPTNWIFPLMNDSEVWRNKANEISDKYKASPGVIATFLADFPGLTLEMCVQPGLDNATVEVLEGEAILEIKDQQNITLKSGEKADLLSDKFFKLHTTSSTIATYFFVAVNKVVRNKALNITTTEPPNSTTLEPEQLQMCLKLGMQFDFAFEGDVHREIEENRQKDNSTLYDSIYRTVKFHIDSAMFNYNATKMAVISLLSKLSINNID